jgi:AAA+ ATPase superfamily predicted ATPase
MLTGLRSAERARLAEYCDDEEAHFVVVHGRRRVGKSVLLTQFLKDRPGVYFEASQNATPADEIRRFLADAFRQLGLGEAHVTADDWLAAFSLVFKLVRPGRRFVLCIDEFPWLAEESPDALSLLKQFWDRNQNDPRLMLVLCGSNTSALKRYFAGSAPVMGRRTRNLEITPLSLRGVRAFFPDYGHDELALAYFLCGGYPGYLRQLDATVSVRRNIERTFLRDDHVFAREADFLLREEQITDIPVYLHILRSVAAGRHRLGEIEAAAETQRAHAVQLLVSLGLLEKRLPVGGKAARPKYFLTNPVLCFGLRFGPALQSFLRLLPAAELYARIQPHLDAYWGMRWEECVLCHLPEVLVAEGTTEVRAHGSYWDDSQKVQVDVVVQESKTRWQFGECKWGAASPTDALAQLRESVSKHPAGQASATQRLRLFFSAKPKAASAAQAAGITVTTVKDLLALPAMSLPPQASG